MKKNLKFYSQLDPEWSHKLIPGTNLSLGRWGCNVTALAIGRSRLFPDDPLDPWELAQQIKFTNRGLVEHYQKYPGFKFVKRFWTWTLAPFMLHDKLFTLKTWIDSDDKNRFAVIAINGSSHFVFAYYWGWRGLYIIDPIDGKKKLLRKTWYLPCGFALYHKE